MHCIEKYEPEKTDDILRPHQRFPREMTSVRNERRNFYTDVAHYLDLDSGVGGVPKCYLFSQASI